MIILYFLSDTQQIIAMYNYVRAFHSVIFCLCITHVEHRNVDLFSLQSTD